MKRAITILGWVMIALSPLPWLALIALPFIGLSFNQGALAGVVLLLAAEGLFLAGAAIVAPDLLRNRGKILAWIRGKKPGDRGGDGAP